MEPAREKIVGVLEDAEKRLRTLIAEAATEGDYRGVDAARQAAVGIKDVRERFSERASGDDSPSVPVPRKAAASSRKGSPARRPSRKAYPKFHVEDDMLTKTAWSKKHKREYAQRVSTDVFDRTVQALARTASAKSSPVLAEEIISAANQSEQDQVPSYQIYIVIAFLREMGCIRQQGRDGYSTNGDVVAKAREEWEKCRQRT